MNIIKKVVVFVMGLVVIGVVATTIGVVTQPKNVEKSVTFELLENNELAFNVYDSINEYALYDNEDIHITNLVSISVNGDYDIFNTPEFFKTFIGASIVSLDETTELNIMSDSTYDGFGINTNDVISITFNVEVETPIIIKTLILLIPLILSASLIGYLSLTVKKGDE